MDFLWNLFFQMFSLGSQKECLLDELILEGVVWYMQSECCCRVICLVGVGIFIFVGIFDFCFLFIGFYDNLEKYYFFYLEVIFEISYFKKYLEFFFVFVKEFYFGQFKLIICYYFMCLLKDKGLFLCCYMQNIDILE